MVDVNETTLKNLNAKFIKSESFREDWLELSDIRKNGFPADIRAGDYVQFSRSTSYKNKRGKWKSEYVDFSAKIDYLSKSGETAHGHLTCFSYQKDGWKSWKKGEEVTFRTNDIDLRSMHENETDENVILFYAKEYVKYWLAVKNGDEVAEALYEAGKFDLLVYVDEAKPENLTFKSKAAEKLAKKLVKERAARLQAEKEAAEKAKAESEAANSNEKSEQTVAA